MKDAYIIKCQKFFDNIFSKYQCGFRKDYIAQHCLLVLIEKWKKVVDTGGAFGALLYLKVLIAFYMTLSLPNWKHMVFI